MLPIFIYPNPNLRCIIQAVAARDLVAVRTFAAHPASTVAAMRAAWIVSRAEAAKALAAPVPPCQVTRATPPGSYIRLQDLPGCHATSVLPDDTMLTEISQTALLADPLLLGSGACSERAEWVVFADSGGQLHAPVNRTLQSHAARAPKTAIYGQMRLNSVLTVLMPFPDSDFARARIYVKANPAYGVVYDAALAYAAEVDGMRVSGLPSQPVDSLPFRWPELRLSAPSQLQADAFADITVHLVDGNNGQPLPETGPQVYLESHAGYLPKRRLTLVDGVATARIAAFGLAAGDHLHLKAGWRYYPGAAEADIVIV